MLRKANIDERDIRYYANSEIDSWPKLMSTLCILSNEAIHIKRTIEEHNARN